MTPLRRYFLLTFVLCIAALFIALFSQHVVGMRPCAWCVFQRLLVLAIAICSLAGLLLERFGRAIAATLTLASTGLAAAGILAAWYQYSVAAQQFSCEQTFADRFMSGSGLDAALPWLFGIYATCMDARVDLFGVEYALWGLALFALITVLSLFALLRVLRA